MSNTNKMKGNYRNVRIWMNWNIMMSCPVLEWKCERNIKVRKKRPETTENLPNSLSLWYPSHVGRQNENGAGPMVSLVLSRMHGASGGLHLNRISVHFPAVDESGEQMEQC